MNLYIPADQYFGLLNISCDRTASFLKALTDEKLEGDGSSICYCTAPWASQVFAVINATSSAITFLAKAAPSSSLDSVQ